MSLARDIAVMRRAGVLGEFGDEELRLLAFGSEHRDARARDVLWRAGEPADGAGLVLSGKLQLAQADGTSHDGVAGVGTLLDEPALFADAHHRFTATALVSTEVLLLPRHAVRRVLSEFPETAQRVHDAMATKTARLLADVDRVAGRFLAE
jgi:CRP-like cAMP-binding protein